MANFKNESIAYGLAAGFPFTDDQDGTKMRRRQRRDRTAALKKAKGE